MARGDYADFARRLRAANARLYGHVEHHPLYYAELLPTGASCATVLISAGIHGDEPAGVEAAWHLLAHPPRWARPFHLVLFPCLNPSGYELHTRANARGTDLNRMFREENPPPEVAAYLRVLAGRRFDLALALHEDSDGRGFYLYELCPRGREFGHHILQRIRRDRILPIDPRPRIENRRNRGGLIVRWPERYRPERRKRWPEAFYVYRNHACHSFTTETPSAYPLAVRIRAQLLAVEEACRTLCAAR